MFDRLIELLAQLWEQILPFYVVKEYESSVLLRLGKFRRIFEAGFHWKIPFADDPKIDIMVMTTMELPVQSITTLDDKDIVTKGIVKYEIEDIKTYILKVYDVKSAISDTTQGIIKKVLTGKTYEEGKDVDDIITQKAKIEAKKWGIKIHRVTLTNYGKIRSLRLFNGDLGNV